MSLLRRLILLTVLAVVSLAIAGIGLARVLRETDSAREAEASSQSDRIARELGARARELLGSPATDLHDDGGREQLRASAQVLIRPLADAGAGLCDAEGELSVIETVTPPEPAPPPGGPPPRPGSERPEGPGHHLFPLDHNQVAELCRSIAGHEELETHTLRQQAPNDLLFITVSPLGDGLATWALVRIPRRVRSLGSLPLTLAAAAALLVLVLVSADTIRQLRAGIIALEDGLQAAQTDLDAPIPRPRPTELGRIADGLRALTTHLAQSRRRELSLEREVAHERRLASLGRVVSGLAHEIRNPLASVKLRLDGMVRRPLDERTHREVEQSLAELARLEAMVRSLLLVARDDPGPLADVDVAALIEQRLEAMEPLADAAAIELVAAGSGMARCAPATLARAIDNLVSNAIEAAPAGTAVELALGGDDERLTIEVRDRGPGVAAEREAELFEPFFTTKADGTGLGLSLARAAIEAHGGTLGYRREGDVTCFRIAMPREGPA
ncbi:MAG: HAMP domain-containing histidine kinase [Myxococcales bacterium]|nr:HAMP domain-containing histidine kinase [Myxococcales bacterium]